MLISVKFWPVQPIGVSETTNYDFNCGNRFFFSGDVRALSHNYFGLPFRVTHTGKPQLEFLEMIQPPAALFLLAAVSCGILDVFALMGEVY